MPKTADEALKALADYWNQVTINGIPRDDHLVKIDAKLLREAAEAYALSQLTSALVAKATSISPPKSLATLTKERDEHKGKPIPTDVLFSSHRQGSIQETTVMEINQVLGFKSNMGGDDKVTKQWRFHVDGQECAIWDYKGSGRYGQFSYFGPHAVFSKLFGIKAIAE